MPDSQKHEQKQKQTNKQCCFIPLHYGVIFYTAIIMRTGKDSYPEHIKLLQINKKKTTGNGKEQKT